MRSARAFCRRGLVSPKAARKWFCVLLVGLAGVNAFAGHLDQEWNGWVTFDDSCPLNVATALKSKQNDGNEEIYDFSWHVNFKKTVTVEVTSGSYFLAIPSSSTIGVWGHCATYRRVPPSTTPASDCSWYLQLNGPIRNEGPDCTLTVDVGPDCAYKITLEGVTCAHEGYYHMLNGSHTPEVCQYSGADGPVDLTFSDDVQAIESSATQMDKLAGTMTATPTLDGAWYSRLVNSFLTRLSAQVPEKQLATVRTVANFGSPIHFPSARWNLSRPLKGHWAGTVSCKIDDTPSAWTNVTACTQANLTGTQTEIVYDNEKREITLNLPADGSQPSGQVTDHLVSYNPVTVEAMEKCDTRLVPYHSQSLMQMTTDAAGAVPPGSSVEVDATGLAAQGKAEVTIRSDGKIPSTVISSYDFTESGGCGGNYEQHMGPETRQEEWCFGTISLDVPAECGRVRGSGEESWAAGPYGASSKMTWNCDLHYIEPSRKMSRGGADTAPRRRLDAEPLVFTGGTIECRFAQASTSDFVVPSGFPQAGSTCHQEIAARYGADLSGTGAGFEAALQADRTSTNFAQGFQTYIVTESTGVATTNTTPATFNACLTAGVTSSVPAVVSGTLDADHYHLHVEIPGAQNGHWESLSRVSRTPLWPELPAEVEHHSSGEDWAIAQQVFDVPGTINPADPTTLAGETALENGYIKWNLKIVAAPKLRLSISLGTNGQICVSWPNGAGVRLQSCSAAENPVWQDVAGSETTNTVVVPAAAKSAFFRLYKQ